MERMRNWGTSGAVVALGLMLFTAPLRAEQPSTYQVGPGDVLQVTFYAGGEPRSLCLLRRTHRSQGLPAGGRLHGFCFSQEGQGDSHRERPPESGVRGSHAGHAGQGRRSPAAPERSYRSTSTALLTSATGPGDMFRSDEIDLKYYGLVIGRWKRLILTVAGACVGLAFVLNLVMQPIYRAVTRVEVSREPSHSPITGE